MTLKRFASKPYALQYGYVECCRNKRGDNVKKLFLIKRKGFNYFLDLAKKIDKDTRIVLVGTSYEQKQNVPENVICIEKTANQKEIKPYSMTKVIFLL